jgi:copper chaperone CopZ
MNTITSDLTTCTLDITGMTCASCVRRVEKALGKVPGVSAAQVNLATEAATITYDPAAATADDLTAAVGTAGYTGLVRPGDEPPATASLAPPEETADAGGRHDGELTRLKSPPPSTASSAPRHSPPGAPSAAAPPRSLSSRPRAPSCRSCGSASAGTDPLTPLRQQPRNAKGRRKRRPFDCVGLPVISPWYWALLGFDLAMRVRNVLWRPQFVMYYRTCPLYAVRDDLTASGFTVTPVPLTALGRRADGSPRYRLVLARTTSTP